MLSSTLRKLVMRNRATAFHASAAREIVTTADDANLEVWHNRGLLPSQPAMFLIHGWLGSATSGYTLSAAMRAAEADFHTLRINLRD
ncbi:MAG: hypothetical protein QF515_15865 [Pseudomonadales bacterium]|nr:hypothetical protein [Pseudomonadales bacterium]